MSNLFHFLTDFAINPQKQIAFAKQPNALLVAAGLSKAEQVVVESKSSNKVAEILANELTRSAFICFDPGQDPLPDPDPPSEPDSSEED